MLSSLFTDGKTEVQRGWAACSPSQPMIGRDLKQDGTTWVGGPHVNRLAEAQFTRTSEQTWLCPTSILGPPPHQACLVLMPLAAKEPSGFCFLCSLSGLIQRTWFQTCVKKVRRKACRRLPHPSTLALCLTCWVVNCFVPQLNKPSLCRHLEASDWSLIKHWTGQSPARSARWVSTTLGFRSF